MHNAHLGIIQVLLEHTVVVVPEARARAPHAAPDQHPPHLPALLHRHTLKTHQTLQLLLLRLDKPYALVPLIKYKLYLIL